jgi:hypothetical protein
MKQNECQTGNVCLGARLLDGNLPAVRKNAGALLFSKKPSDVEASLSGLASGPLTSAVSLSVAMELRLRRTRIGKSIKRKEPKVVLDDGPIFSRFRR